MDSKKKFEIGQCNHNVTGFSLFTKNFYKKEEGNYKSVQEGNPHLKKAWRKLSKSKKEKYNKKAKKLRGPRKEKTYSVSFHTRCAPNQFMKVCKVVKERDDLMKRLKKIGFDKLVNLSFPSIQREFCAELIRAFDPQTKKICIRGLTVEMKAELVHKIMGITLGGKEIKIDLVNEEDEAFKKHWKVYRKMPYNDIASRLVAGKEDKNFEFLFVLYALGTLLCPGSGVRVSEYLLKVMVLTKDGLSKYDWASFVFTELCKSMEDYKRELRRVKGSGKKNVGGCIYFLMVSPLSFVPTFSRHVVML